jgi:ATP-binding cassette, subfamily C (CFTR/MRP), member 1
VTILLLFVATLIGKRIGPRQAAWLKATDARVKYITSLVSNMLPIKWSGYEDVLAGHARDLRTTEMREAKAF